MLLFGIPSFSYRSKPRVSGCSCSTTRTNGPKPYPFATLGQRTLKSPPRTRSGSGARVVEKAARIRNHFASARPDAVLFRLLAGRLAASGP